MSPFSHRLPPPTIEPLAPLSLQSGEYQSADDPPPASVFKRGQPQPPHSLAPVSMHAEAVLATGPHMPVVEVRRGPGLFTGITILLAGIAIGSLVGLTTRKTPNPADVLAQVQNTAPPMSLVAPSASPQAAPKEAPKDPAKDAAKDPNAKDANAKDPNAKDPNAKDGNAKDPNAKETKKHRRFVGGDPSVAAAHAPKTPKEPKEPKEPTTKASKEKDGDDGYTVASADNGRSKPVLSDSAPNAKSEAKSDAKSESKSDAKEASRAASGDTKKPSKSAPASSKAASDDAVNVLRAAMGATENTL